jgi:hypothetical protein
MRVLFIYLMISISNLNSHFLKPAWWHLGYPRYVC